MTHAAVALLVVVPAYGIALGRAGVSLRVVAAQLARPLAGGALAAAAGVAVALLVGDTLAQVFLGGTLVALVYAASVYPMRSMLRAPAVAS